MRLVFFVTHFSSYLSFVFQIAKLLNQCHSFLINFISCIGVSSHRLAPFLEESHTLAPAIRSPQIASTGAGVAAIVGPLVTADTTTDTTTSEDKEGIWGRRTSGRRISDYNRIKLQLTMSLDLLLLVL